MTQRSTTRTAAREQGRSDAKYPALGRRERNKREKQERILQAAGTLFREQGFESTTTQQIAELADVGFGTLYLYCESKEDLLVQVFKGEVVEVVREAFACVPKRASLPRQLEHFFTCLIAYHERDLPLARALIRELSIAETRERRRVLQDLMQTIFGSLTALIERAQERGEVRADVDPLEAARTTFAVYYQLLQAFLGHYMSAKRFRAQLRASLELLMGGLSAASRP